MAGLRLLSWLFVIYVIIRLWNGEINFFVALFIGALLLLFIPPIWYKLRLKEKVRKDELTEAEAFNKVSRFFGYDLANIAYLWTFDKWYIEQYKKGKIR